MIRVVISSQQTGREAVKKLKALMLGVAAFGVCISGSALAQDKEAGSGPNPFTDCGIGAALFPNTGWAAVTSNVIWDVGTTAVISATASPETCSGSSAQAAKFINDTYDSVIEDTARGDGEYVATLLEIYGPLFMSYPAISNVQIRIAESDGESVVTLRHTAMGFISDDHRAGVSRGWTPLLDRVERAVS